MWIIMFRRHKHIRFSSLITRNRWLHPSQRANTILLILSNQNRFLLSKYAFLSSTTINNSRPSCHMSLILILNSSSLLLLSPLKVLNNLRSIIMWIIMNKLLNLIKIIQIHQLINPPIHNHSLRMPLRQLLFQIQLLQLRTQMLQQQLLLL